MQNEIIMEASGVAKDNAATQQFLNCCPAVTVFRNELADCGAHGGKPCPGETGYLRFYFDDSIEVPVIPPGVWFDVDTMTPAERSAWTEALCTHHDTAA